MVSCCGVNYGMTDDVGREPQYQKKSSSVGSRFWYVFL